MIDGYGLGAAFLGPRWIAERSDRVLALGHGDPSDVSAPRIQVGVALEPTRPTETIDIHNTVWTGLVLSVAEARLAALRDDPPALDEARERILDQTVAGQPDAEQWKSVEIEVDGGAEAFQSIDLGSSWAAFRKMDDRWLYVVARQTSGLPAAIVRIQDLTPYR